MWRESTDYGSHPLIAHLFREQAGIILSRAILAGRFFEADSTYYNMLVLREAVENFGIPCLLYSDNDSKFKLIRYPGSRFFTYRQETLAGEVITHEPGNAQAKGKIERLFRFIQERFIAEHTAPLPGMGPSIPSPGSTTWWPSR